MHKSFYRFFFVVLLRKGEQRLLEKRETQQISTPIRIRSRIFLTAMLWRHAIVSHISQKWKSSGLVTVRVKSVVFTNKVGKNSPYCVGVFNKTIILLALVGYEIIIANSALRASLAISTIYIQRALVEQYTTIPRKGRWMVNNYLPKGRWIVVVRYTETRSVEVYI